MHVLLAPREGDLPICDLTAELAVVDCVHEIVEAAWSGLAIFRSRGTEVFCVGVVEVPLFGSSLQISEVRSEIALVCLDGVAKGLGSAGRLWTVFGSFGWQPGACSQLAKCRRSCSHQSWEAYSVKSMFCFAEVCSRAKIQIRVLIICDGTIFNIRHGSLGCFVRISKCRNRLPTIGK